MKFDNLLVKDLLSFAETDYLKLKVLMNGYNRANDRSFAAAKGLFQKPRR